MIAMVTTAQSLAHAVHYNEQKVSTGKARFLLGMNFPSGNPSLLRTTPLQYLQMQADRNTRVKIKCLHITLNFDVTERLDTDWHKRLSTVYMDRIGFGAQPYLVYEHLDAAHPHLHLVTTPIDPEGKRILVNNLIRYDSYRVTREMESEFDLLRSHQSVHEGVYDQMQPAHPLGNLLQEAPAPMIQYGQETMSSGMERVLKKVLIGYKFSNLEEFNALLRPYHLQADRGRPSSQIFLHRGLVYKVMNEEGQQQGNYIKASQLSGKPTLSFLEGRFERYRTEQLFAAPRVRNAIDWAVFSRDKPTLSLLQDDLQSNHIQTVWRLPKGTESASVVYVDHQSRWALGESVLGETYTAPAILERCHLDVRDLEKALTSSKETRQAFIEEPTPWWPHNGSPILSQY